MSGQLITFKYEWGISRLGKSHFKLLVRVGMCTVSAVDTDKWCRQWAVLELEDAVGWGREFAWLLQFICVWSASRLHTAPLLKVQTGFSPLEINLNLHYLPAKTLLTSKKILSDYWIKNVHGLFSNKTSDLYKLFVRNETWMMVLFPAVR